MLGGLEPMPHLRNLLQAQGTNFDNFFATTPVCCPSRTTILSGRYPHNTGQPTDGWCGNTPSSDYKRSTVAYYLHNFGYATGMFGKYLNNYETFCFDKANPIPPGWDRWFTMCDDSKYFDNAFNDQGNMVSSGETLQDYMTSIIGNQSIRWMQERLEKQEPFFSYIALHAPHVPATPAPWYQRMFSNGSAPRTPNFNFHAVDHHWIVRQQQEMDSQHTIPYTDELFRRRWQTLVSIDDLLRDIVILLSKYNQLDNTYILYTSDHGYQLGQFRLPLSKLQAYEHDIRVPMILRGPGITPNTHIEPIAGLVDLAPTVLELVGAPVPDTMDGISLVPLLQSAQHWSKQLEESAQREANNYKKHRLNVYPIDLLQQRGEGKKDKLFWRSAYLLEYWANDTVIRGPPSYTEQAKLPPEGLGHIVDIRNNTLLGLRVKNSTHDLLYAEYTDKNDPFFKAPLEFEYYNITEDPWQMHNNYKTAPSWLIQDLRSQLHQLFLCKGKQCRL
ncbi:Glucosamine (N-acetyl)-6-sulfatase (Sanfilippo disease IIID), b, variant 2 [Balamuthia mandrillaris]